jgi:hypothetical protein
MAQKLISNRRRISKGLIFAERIYNALSPPGTAAGAKRKPMKSETITQREDLVIRRHILEPGEALPWHTDLCHRFTVVVHGETLSIEYRDSGEIETFPVHPGLADWDAPQPKVHRGINAGTVPYEEVIIFFIDEPGMEPQPEAA